MLEGGQVMNEVLEVLVDLDCATRGKKNCLKFAVTLRTASIFTIS